MLAERVFGWNDGRPKLRPFTQSNSSKWISFLAISNRLGTRLQKSNGSTSVMGIGGDTEGEVGPTRQLSATSATTDGTPWEPHGVKESFNKVKEAAGRVLEKVKGKWL